MQVTPETLTRVKTGVLGGLLFLSLLLFGGMIGITFITAVITLAMAWELSLVFLKLSDHQEKRKAILGAAWIIIFVNVLSPKSIVESLVLAVLLFFSYFLAVANRHEDNLHDHFMELIYTVFILVYVVSFMVFLPMVRAGAHGLQWTVLFFLIVWAGDTGAYFAGRKFGGRKLYPLISPGKTVSGALGVIAAGLVITILYKLLIFKALGIFGMLVIPIIIGAVAQIGDLCESFLKRAYNMKDMSKILPGHGGMLDRFDGILFALPIMYFCIKAFG